MTTGLSPSKAFFTLSLQVKTFVETTSAHGFGFYLASSSWLSKSIWILITLLGIFFSIFFTVKICLNSLQPPFFSVEIDIQSEDIADVHLPDIVLCDPSPWDYEKALAKNISADLLAYISYMLFPLMAGPDMPTFYGRIKAQETKYQTLLKQFDNSPIKLLDSVTKVLFWYACARQPCQQGCQTHKKLIFLY